MVKSAKAVQLYVFNIAFPLSLFNRSDLIYLCLCDCLIVCTKTSCCIIDVEKTSLKKRHNVIFLIFDIYFFVKTLAVGHQWWCMIGESAAARILLVV